MKALSSLFSPGRGAKPPHLAGRDETLAKMERAIPKMAGKPPARDIVLVGPRGNGKTALLGEFARRCREEGADVLATTPEKIKTESLLIAWLLEPSQEAPRRDIGEKGALSRFSPAIASLVESVRDWTPRVRTLGIPGLIGMEFPDMPRGAKRQVLLHLDRLIAEASLERPRVAIIDEAHTLDPELGRTLLNTAQNANALGAPFLLVLAGTPQLPGRLRSMKASFWERCLEIGVGRLSGESACEALEKPLAAHGVSFAPAALDAVVEDSQRYPYFVQMWGEALCLALPEGASRIEAATVESARAGVEEEKTTFCNRRYMELLDEGLVPAASALAKAFKGRKSLDLLSAVEIAGDSRKPLERLGYIWQPTGKTAYEPGIPSLAAHVLAVGAAQGFSPSDEMSKFGRGPNR